MLAPYGQQYKPVVRRNFVLVPNSPELKKGQTLRIVFKTLTH